MFGSMVTTGGWFTAKGMPLKAFHKACLNPYLYLHVLQLQRLRSGMPLSEDKVNED
jgi:hypothetical protein